jgi:hypothetical protein
MVARPGCFCVARCRCGGFICNARACTASAAAGGAFDAGSDSEWDGRLFGLSQTTQRWRTAEIA